MSLIGPNLIVDPMVVGTDLSQTSGAPGESHHAAFLRAKMRIAYRKFLDAYGRAAHVMAAYDELPDQPRRRRDRLTRNLLGEGDARVTLAMAQVELHALAVQTHAAAYQVEMARTRLWDDSDNPREDPNR